MDGSNRVAPERTPGPDECAWLVSRLGPEYASRRARLELAAEAKGARRETKADLSFWALLDKYVARLLKAAGMLDRGQANAARIQVTRNSVEIPGLPRAFHGYTLLHITDLHADISLRAMRALPEVIRTLPYDACVITGDFRGRTYGPFARTLEIVRDAIVPVTTPIFGVLGNHDTARIVPGLEALGIRMLMNENEPIERDGSRLWIVGVDDPHHYRTDDLGRAFIGIPDGGSTVLLAHSTDGVMAAAAAGVSLMLSGHTHGGQICLPGSIPVLTSSRMPRRFAKGRWRQGAMHGYTARGVGTSAVDARFNCPPEVVLHTLLCEPRPPQQPDV
ncbi:MAG TPA: metallophosphoesterase [Rhodopila sp.]|nr:metallophosphoesterase [Rhodopila sp.]